MVTNVVLPTISKRVLPLNLEEMFLAFNLLADVLFRKLTMGGDEAPATMTKKSRDGTSKSCKRSVKDKETCGELEALVDKPAAARQLNI